MWLLAKETFERGPSHLALSLSLSHFQGWPHNARSDSPSTPALLILRRFKCDMTCILYGVVTDYSLIGKQTDINSVCLVLSLHVCCSLLAECQRQIRAPAAELEGMLISISYCFLKSFKGKLATGQTLNSRVPGESFFLRD